MELDSGSHPQRRANDDSNEDLESRTSKCVRCRSRIACSWDQRRRAEERTAMATQATHSRSSISARYPLPLSMRMERGLARVRTSQWIQRKPDHRCHSRVQDVRDRSHQRTGTRRCGLRGRARRNGGRDGTVRVRQDDAAQLPERGRHGRLRHWTAPRFRPSPFRRSC
jgi:hypothetical protein